MVQNQQIVQLIGLDSYGDVWPDGHAMALKDFDPTAVRGDFDQKYRGQSDEFSYHFKAYLLKHQYIVMVPPEYISTVYL